LTGVAAPPCQCCGETVLTVAATGCLNPATSSATSASITARQARPT